jgi:hypothetical protein
MSFLEAVNCKRCQRLCYYQQASFAWPEDDPQWLALDVPPPIVACTACMHVYDYQDQKPKIVPSPEGLAPASPDASMRVFEETIECDDVDCETQITVVVVLKSNTSAGEIEEVKRGWIVVGAKCADHDFQWPPYPHPR